jgi:hypothetical protein
MSAPNLSATVPSDQRFRVVYRLTSPLSTFFGGVDERITAAWQGSAIAVVIAPATTPDVGGTTRLTGPLEAFTAIDIKSSYTMPSVTWDNYLAPFRRPSLGLALGFVVTAEISSVELLTPAALSSSTAPAARTAAAQTPAAASRASSPSLAGLVTTATNRALLLGLLALGIVVAWKMGPQLMQLVKARK